MPDPRKPRQPQLPAPYKSDWSPRPLPQPAPERRTADPPTHTLKELAARTQRASVADATHVVPPAVAPRSDARPSVGAAPSTTARAIRAFNPLADKARYEALEQARQSGTVADKVRRRAQRAALVARGRTAGARALDPSQGQVTVAANRLEQFSRDIELARLSNDMYNEHSSTLGWTRISDDPNQLPRELRNPALWQDEGSNYCAGLYKEADELGGRVVLAFRGTDERPGWYTDVEQSAGMRTEQYAAARRIAQAARQVYGSRLVVTGHSLGGGLATEAAALTGAHGATFNPSGLNPESLHDTGKLPRDAANLLRDYHVPTEVLSRLQSPVGRALLGPSTTILHLGLAVTGQLGRAPTVKDLIPTTIPGPMGQHVALPYVNAAEVPLLTAGVRHMGIFAVQGMEEQKEIDRAMIERYAGTTTEAN